MKSRFKYLIMSYVFLAIIIGAVTFYKLFGPPIYYNVSDSLPRGFYIETTKNLSIGKLIAFPIPKNAKQIIFARKWLAFDMPLLKYISAIAGDEICIKKHGLYINKNRFGHIVETDDSNNHIQVSFGCYVLSDNELFVTTGYHKSFDSRYFGPIKIKDVLSTIKPLLTF